MKIGPVDTEIAFLIVKKNKEKKKKLTQAKYIAKFAERAKNELITSDKIKINALYSSEV